MNEILPDGGKPIQVGDPSFIYNGVYHPIYWNGLDPYRPRVEMLVIDNGCKVYLRMYDKSPEFDYQYRIPGGSIDNDSTKLEQAIAETNEEGLLDVVDAQYANVQYYELYKPNFVLKGGDMPLSYKGSINDVFVAKYSRPYDKKRVEVKDLDDDMANNGKFYWIDQIADKLRPEHRQALINCPFVNGAMKRIMRQLELPELSNNSGTDLNTYYYVNYPMDNPKTIASVTPTPGVFYKNYKDGLSIASTVKRPTRVPCYKDLNVAITAFMHYHPSYHGAVAIYEVDPLETHKIISTSGTSFDEYWSLEPIRIIWVGDVVTVPTTSFQHEKYVDGIKVRETITNRKILSWSKRNRMIQDKVVTEGTTTIPIPGGLLYHASTSKIDSFQPMSLDLGNEINPPGWSTFCFADKELAIRFGIMRAIQKMGIPCGWHIPTNRPYLLEKGYTIVQNFHNIAFYVYTIDPEYCDVTAGNDSRFPELIFRNSGVIPKDTSIIIIPISSIDEYVTILQKEPSSNTNPNVNSYYATMLNHDYSQSDYVVSKLENAIKSGRLKPGDDVEKFMKMNQIEFDKDSFIKSFSNATSVEEALSFSSYKRIPLTNDTIKKFQSKCPQLKHVRTGPMCKGYIWLDGDDVVAYLNTEEKSEPNDVWIQALEVLPDYRGNRFAERMIRVATDELCATKLSVNVKNEKAIKIYKNNGFRIFSEDSTMYYMSTSAGTMDNAEQARWFSDRIEPIFDTIIMEDNYPYLDDDEFGVPSKRKFPLDTREHVKSAIRFFNYVDKDDEEELARRLIKRMKETNLYGTVKVGKKNRLSSYLEGTIPQFGSNARYAVSTHENKIPTSPMFQSTLALAIRANHCENGSYFAFAQVGNKIYPIGEFIFRFTNPNEYQYEIEWVNSSNIEKSVVGESTNSTDERRRYMNAGLTLTRRAPRMEPGTPFKNGKFDVSRNVVTTLIDSLQDYDEYCFMKDDLDLAIHETDEQIQIHERYIAGKLNFIRAKYVKSCEDAGVNVTTLKQHREWLVSVRNKLIRDEKKYKVSVESTEFVVSSIYDHPNFLSVVMEAPGDDEERPKTPIDDDEPTDYGDDNGGAAEDNEVDAEEDRPPTPIDDDEPTDYGEDDTDDGEETSTDEPTEGEERPETPIDDDELTDYDDPSGNEDAGSVNDESGDGDTTADTTSDDNSNNNNLVKNYSLMLDFEKLFAFVEDVGNTLESTLKAVPVQNKVLIQVSRNLTTIQNFIKEFIQFYFKADDFQFNLYYYEVVVQALKLNLSMIEEINKIES